MARPRRPALGRGRRGSRLGGRLGGGWLSGCGLSSGELSGGRLGPAGSAAGSSRRRRARVAARRGGGRGRRVVSAAAPRVARPPARGLVVREVRGRHAWHRVAADGDRTSKEPSSFAATIVPGPPSRLWPGDVSGATTARSPARNAGGAAAGAGAGATRARFSGWRGDDAPRRFLERASCARPSPT